MSKEEIFNKIQAIIVEQLDVTADKVTMTTNFKDDLQADSLDVFEVIDQIEDQFDVEIETEEGLLTVGDVTNFVIEHLAK